MSTPPISPAHKNSSSSSSSSLKKSSGVLGSSRKILSSTVKRPFKGRKRKNSKSNKEETEELTLPITEYGTLMEEVSEHSNESHERIVAVVPAIPDCSNRSLVISDDPNSSTTRRVVGDPDWPVHSMERIMRQVLLVCAAYILGCKRPEWLSYVARATEYAVTAWGTTVLILLLAYVQKHYPRLVGGGTTTTTTTTTMLEEQPQRMSLLSYQQQKRHVLVEDEQLHDEEPEEDERNLSMEGVEESSGSYCSLPHPSLSPLYIVDAYSGERIIPNNGPTHLSTEWFEMDMLALIRTPDTDDPIHVKPGTAANQSVVEYLRGKQRRFEFQYQLKLKKVPVGKQVYFSCELEEPIKMGLIQKAFVGAAMAFMKSTNPTFHYSVAGSKEKSPDGKYEKPHMSFTVEDSLNRLVVTKPGETPPKLGQDIVEDPESIKRRKKGGLVLWNTEDTYTMALWSAYVDFLDWRVLNLPGIRPFSLFSVLGNQSMNMTMYLIEADRGNDKHYRADITNVVNLELCNDQSAMLGPAADRWVKENNKKAQKKRNRTLLAQESGSGEFDEPTTPGENKPSSFNNGDLVGESPTGRDIQPNRSGEDFNAEEMEDVDEDAETAAELGEGIYLRSGDSVVLREFAEIENADEATTYSVANGGGFAVLQEDDVCVVIKKVTRSKRNRLIKSGDTVMFKMIQNKGEEVETRYLTIHRGWWLKWASTPPSKNGSFTIYTHESEFGEKDEKQVRSGETQSSFLTMGGSFTLRHKRWSRYNVGVAQEPSPTYGGRMLGLYNPKSKNGSQDDDEQYHSDEGGEGPVTDGDQLVLDNKTKAGWMKPLVLCALEPNSLLPASMSMTSWLGAKTNMPVADDNNILESPSFVTPDTLVFSIEHSQVDVPAWIEMMNRTERIRQLTYVVRVIHRIPAHQEILEEGKEDDELEDSELIGSTKDREPQSFVKLRTGRELSQLMAVGQNTRASSTGASGGGGGGRKAERRKSSSAAASSPTEFQTSLSSGKGQASRSSAIRHSFVERSPSPSNNREPMLSLSPAIRAKNTSNIPLDLSIDLLEKPEDSDDSSKESYLEEDEREDDKASVDSFEPELGDDEIDQESSESEPESESEQEQEGRKKHGAVSKGKKIIGKVAKGTGKLAAKTVKGTGKLTAKTVVGTGKLTAKTVVGTGKLTAKTVVGTGKLTGKVAVGAGKVAVGTGKSAGRLVKKGAKGTKSITMSAGKAVVSQIPRKSKKPPKAEPKAKRKEKETLHVEVSKTM